MGRLRGRLRRLFRAADEELISIELLDGTVARFSLEAYKECFIHETDRSKAHFIGEEVPPPHPIILALR
jgi:hypothetical protein